MHMEKTRDVRKGAWTHEEDDLLKDCIKKYGEGKWHLVPQRAGLNRCRKSCRLRWLNYLNPNINRKSFVEDEVDMILRLHNLLGNRWSLIAARLPGRTANDVKNYWHTHLRKKVALLNEEEKKEREKPHYHEVIKPMGLRLNKEKHNFASGGGGECAETSIVNEDACVHKDCDMLPIDGKDCVALQPSNGDDDGAMWWESLWDSEDQIDSIEKDSILEFAKDLFSTDHQGPTHWEFNFCDVRSNLDL